MKQHLWLLMAAWLRLRARLQPFEFEICRFLPRSDRRQQEARSHLNMPYLRKAPALRQQVATSFQK
jgi:hypothetical protein